MGKRPHWKQRLKKTSDTGRQKGDPNMIRKDGKLINKHGVEITEAEKKRFVSLVNSATRKRKKMLDAAGNLEVYMDGKPAGYTLAQKYAMALESDFILAKKSKSLHQFEKRSWFDAYMRELERVNAPGYVEKTIRQYKKNWLKAFRDNIFPHGKDVYYAINFMSIDDYTELVEGNEDFEISYIYDPAEIEKRVAAMRAALAEFKARKKGKKEIEAKDPDLAIDSEFIE